LRKEKLVVAVINQAVNFGIAFLMPFTHVNDVKIYYLVICQSVSRSANSSLRILENFQPAKNFRGYSFFFSLSLKIKKPLLCGVSKTTLK